jgi:hypothetical protein
MWSGQYLLAPHFLFVLASVFFHYPTNSVRIHSFGLCDWCGRHHNHGPNLQTIRGISWRYSSTHSTDSPLFREVYCMSIECHASRVHWGEVPVRLLPKRFKLTDCLMYKVIHCIPALHCVKLGSRNQSRGKAIV